MLSKGNLLYKTALRYYSTNSNNLFSSTFKETKKVIESSTLKNGMKVISLTGGYTGPAASLGLYIKSGSRNETKETAGIHQFLKNLVFQSNAEKIQLEVQREIESTGSTAFAQASRDSLLISTQTLPDYALQILNTLGNVTNPALSYHEVRDTSDQVSEETEAYNHCITSSLIDSLHQQAYRGKALGRPLIAPSCNIGNISQEKVVSYVNQTYTPSNMVLVSVGLNHNELVNEANSIQFGRGTSNTTTSNENTVSINKEQSKYFGGESLQYSTGNTHVVLAFEGSSQGNVKDVAALLVLQKLLGLGGTSKFSHGYTFGKTSRLSALVSNNPSVLKAESFNLHYGDSGLFGLLVETEESSVQKVISLLTSELVSASKEQSSGEELNRAKALAKTSIIESAEERSDALEFIGRQAIHSDKVLSPSEFAEEISKVTSDDIKRVTKKMFSSKPTLIVNGDISNVPTLEEISSSLKL